MTRLKLLFASCLLAFTATHCAAQNDRSWVPENLSKSSADSFERIAAEVPNPCSDSDLSGYQSLKALLEAGKNCREAQILSADVVFFLKHDAPESRIIGFTKEQGALFKKPHQFNLENRPRLGDAAAPVEIVVFSDFQCPYCAIAAETLHKVYDARPESVSVVFKNLPLHEIHPYAAPAALVATYAHSQGKFWEIHDRFFASQKQLDPDLITEIVESLGTTVDALFDSENNLQYGVVVIEDMKEAEANGIQGTPAIFVNGIEVLNGLRYDRLMARVEAEIRSPLENTNRAKSVACPYPGLEADYSALTPQERANLGMYTAASLCPCKDSSQTLHVCAAQNTCPAAQILVKRIIQGIANHVPDADILREIDTSVQNARSGDLME